MNEPLHPIGEEIETILNKLIALLNEHNATAELSLSVLGNAATFLINTQFSPEQRPLNCALIFNHINKTRYSITASTLIGTL